MKGQKQLKKEFKERCQWFIDRIGKRIYRTKTSCDCKTCTRVYNEGLVIEDKFHATYVSDISGEEGLKYFDTLKERNQHEKRIIL